MLESRVLQAIDLKRKGYNCCQCIVSSYADLIDVDKSVLFKISEGFGLGIAGTMNVCGVISAITLLASTIYSDGNLDCPKSKTVTYKKINDLIEIFKRKNSTIICADLKGITTGVVKRSCLGAIEDACLIIEENLFPGMFNHYIEK